MKISHEDLIKGVRHRVGALAEGMLNGSIDYLEGSVELASLRFKVGVSEFDQDFLSFVGIASEIDHLPIGASREHWSPSALERLAPEIESTKEWAKEISLCHLKSLLERFNA